MADKPCNSEECQAHTYVMDLIVRLDETQEKLMDGQADIKGNLVKLTENLFEIQRLNTRFDQMMGELKEKDASQDIKIDQNSAFVNKAIGVVGAISLIAVCSSAVTAVLSFLFK